MAGHTASKTKPWNTNLESLEHDEQVYVDYKTENKVEAVCMKFKTSQARLPLWLDALHDAFPEGEWEKQPLCEIMKLKDKDDRRKHEVTVKIHNTGVILLQGSHFAKWQREWFSVLQHKVDALENLESRNGEKNTRKSTDDSIIVDDDDDNEGKIIEVTVNKNSNESKSSPQVHSMNENTMLNNLLSEVKGLHSAYMSSIENMKEIVKVTIKTEVDDLRREMIEEVLPVNDLLKQNSSLNEQIKMLEAEKESSKDHYQRQYRSLNEQIQTLKAEKESYKDSYQKLKSKYEELDNKIRVVRDLALSGGS